MSARAPDVSWKAPADGAFTRTLRLGEWIYEPVTPLFESWLLTTMEDRLHFFLRRWIGQHAPRPYHVVVNGWYFYSINWLSGAALARSLPDILLHLIRSPRRVAGVVPPTVRHSIPIFEREWREDLQPRHRAAVADAERRVETLPVTELPALIDGLAALAGESFASIAALTGAAYKMEMNLARSYRKQLGRLARWQPPAPAGGLRTADRPGPACRRVARLVARDIADLGDDDPTTRGAPAPGRDAASGGGGCVPDPRLVAPAPSGLPAPPGRDAAPRPDP